MLNLRFSFLSTFSLFAILSVSCGGIGTIDSNQKHLEALDSELNTQQVDADALKSSFETKVNDANLPKFLEEDFSKSVEDAHVELDSDIETLFGIYSNSIQDQDNGLELVDIFAKTSNERIVATNEKLEKEFQNLLTEKTLHEGKIAIYKSTLLTDRKATEANIADVYTPESAKDVLGFFRAQTGAIEALIEENASTLEYEDFETTMDTQVQAFGMGFIDYIFDTSPKLAD